jgi:hypothetical protein
MLTRPSFQSKVPEYLLEKASEKDRYIIEQLSVIGQTQEWLVDETIKQSSKLESVDDKVSELDDKLKYTNGKIGSAILQIHALETKNEADKQSDFEIKKIVSAKLFLEKYLINKYGIGIFFLFVIGIIKVLTTPELKEILFKIIGI